MKKAKIANITKKHYYTVDIDCGDGNSFSFDVDENLHSISEADDYIITCMKIEDQILTRELFAEIRKNIERIPK